MALGVDAHGFHLLGDSEEPRELEDEEGEAGERAGPDDDHADQSELRADGVTAQTGLAGSALGHAAPSWPQAAAQHNTEAKANLLGMLITKQKLGSYRRLS